MFSPPNPGCSYPYYTKDLRFEGASNTNVSDLFETEQATKISEVFTGEFGAYDGSGFLSRFAPYSNYTNTSSPSVFFFQCSLTFFFKGENNSMTRLVRCKVTHSSTQIPSLFFFNSISIIPMRTYGLMSI